MPTSLQARLLVTKTQRPRRPLRLIARERLFAQMDAARSRTLTVIQAAAGFGKTSLAITWAERLAQQGCRIAWVSLDHEDDEPSQFLLYLAQALRSACPEIDKLAFHLLAEVALIRPFDVVRLLINALVDVEEDIFLFLDDYHVLRHADVTECTAYLLRHAPPQLHVVLTTRTEPDLPLARLRAQGQLVEIGAHSLRFDLDETRRFLGQEIAGDVGSSEAAALQEKTEGWPVMLRIVATISQQSGQDFGRYVRELSARSRPIRSHLDDMLNGLPDEVVGFLLRVSILESLSAPLCQEVTRRPQAAEIFESLASRQLLLAPLDADGVWFRCHPLLRQFLAQKLELEFPEEIAELHRHAYSWYARMGLWTDAIRHAITAGDTAEAVQWIGKCAMAVLRRGELRTLLAWERIVPPEMMRRQVKAHLAIAWGMALALRFDEARLLATQIEREISEADPPAREAIGCECQTIRAVALALSDNVDEALELAEDSLRRNSSGPWTANVAANVALIGWWKRGVPARCYNLPWISFPGDDGGRNVVATVYRLCLLGLIEYDQLHQATASRHFREAMRVASEYQGAKSAAAAQPATLTAQCLYDQGRWDDAEEMLADRLTTINAVCMLECVLRAYVVLIRVAAHRGQRDRVEDLLEQGDRLASSRGWPRLQSRMWRERARVAVIDGRVSEASSCVSRLRDLAKTTEGRSASVQNEIQDDLDVSEAMLRSAEGNYRAAIGLLESLSARAMARHNLRVELECTADLAIAFAQDNAAEASLTQLRAALSKACDTGRIQVFLDCVRLGEKSLVGQLRRIRAPADPENIVKFARLIEARLGERPSGDEPTSMRGAQGTPLSPREENILRLVVEGQSNKDIARSLNVTPETVKTHMKRIFYKLNAVNRSQAVSKALRDGLCAAPVRS